MRQRCARGVAVAMGLECAVEDVRAANRTILATVGVLATAAVAAGALVAYVVVFMAKHRIRWGLLFDYGPHWPLWELLS